MKIIVPLTHKVIRRNTLVNICKSLKIMPHDLEVPSSKCVFKKIFQESKVQKQQMKLLSLINYKLNLTILAPLLI